MSYILGYPLLKGNSNEVVSAIKDASSTLQTGTIVCTNENGEVTAYDPKYPIAGILGLDPLNGMVEISKRGLHIPVIMADSQMPNGSFAFVEKDGKISTKGEMVIGTFIGKDTINAKNPTNGEINSNCGLIDLSLNLKPSAQAPETSGKGQDRNGQSQNGQSQNGQSQNGQSQNGQSQNGQESVKDIKKK